MAVKQICLGGKKMLTVNPVSPKVQGNQNPATKPEEHEEKQLMQPTSKSKSSWIPKATGGLTTLLAALIAANAEAANNPAREKAVAKMAEDSWTPLSQALGDEKKLSELNNTKMLWNNLQAVMHVADDTMIEAVEPIRASILEKGKSSPHIPARVVHGALYTTGVTAQKLNIEILKNQKRINTLTDELKALQKQVEGLSKVKAQTPKELSTKIQGVETQIADLNKQNTSYAQRVQKMATTVVPYLGKTIVDTTSSDGVKERHLIPPSDLSRLAASRRYTKIEPYRNRDFHLAAADAIGKIAESSTLEGSLNELFSSGNDVTRRNTFFEITLSIPQDKLSKSLIQKSREWVFGSKQLEAHEKAKLSKGAPGQVKTNPPVMPPALNNPPGVTPQPAPPPVPNPGLPPGSRAGSLDELKKIDERLVSPLLPFPFGKDDSDQVFMAKNILLLAQNNDEFALPAAAQWFAVRHISEDSDGKGSQDANFIVLQALAKLAQKDKTAFEVLKRVSASNPNMFFESYVAGEIFLDNFPDARAGMEVIKAFNANSTSAREWLTQVADRKANHLWPEPTNDVDTKTLNDLRDKGRRYSLMIMAFLDDSRSFAPYLRGILQNPFAKTEEKFPAAVGVALAKDRDSIEPLMAMGMDETLSSGLRGLALDAALYINVPDLAPDSIRQKAQGQSPFAPSGLRAFFPELRLRRSEGERPKLNFANELTSQNPFKRKLISNFNIWLQQQEGLNREATSKGRPPITISDEEKMQVLSTLHRREFGGNAGLFALKAKEANFTAKYLTPMVNYLERNKDGKRNIDIFLAWSMMDVLSRAGHKEAAPVMTDIATYPERYLQNREGSGIFGLLFDALAQSFLKAAAVQNLGGVVPLDDENNTGAQVLHTVARKDSSSFYRWAAWYGLDSLADRYDQYNKNPHTLGPEDLKIQAARQTHGQRSLGHMLHHAKGLETAGQMRLSNMFTEFMWAKMADRFGARKQLLTVASNAHRANEKAQVVRSVMHALISNGHKSEDIAKLGFDAKTQSQLEALYKSIDRQEYWLGDSSKHAYTGKGVEQAVLDVGYAYPVLYPGLEKNLIYPEKLIRWNDLTRNLDLHPTAVAATTHKIAPDNKMWTYSVVATTPEIPYRPHDTQTADFMALEDMAQNMLEDKANISAINYSWGFWNIVLQSPELRNEWVDMLGAYMETLSRMDVMHTVAAGNSHGMFPAFGRYRGTELNNPGLRFNDKGDIIQPDNVIMAAAMDRYADRLAEFTSKEDPLRKLEHLRLLAFQGVHVIAPWVDNGQWNLEPVNGTSFAAPHSMGILAWGIEARKKAGLAPLTAKEWNQVFSKSIGRFKDQPEQPYFDATLFLQEVLRPQAAAQPQPAVAGKKQ